MDNFLLERLQSGDKKALAEVYSMHRSSFIQFALKYHRDEALIYDIYQDAVIALYEKALMGKLQLETCHLKTYLFSIGKFMLFTKLKKNSKMEFLEDDQQVLDQYEEESLTSFFYEPDPQVKILENNIAKLGSKCQELLRLFYYEEKKIHEIKEIMGYNHNDVVKSQKSRCMKSLKDAMNSKSFEDAE